MAKRHKSAALNLYITPELKDAAEKTAEADQRSLTSLVEKLLTDAAKAAGFWPPADVDRPEEPQLSKGKTSSKRRG